MPTSVFSCLVVVLVTIQYCVVVKLAGFIVDGRVNYRWLCFAVFDILLRYTETGSWKEAFFQVIPKRKQVQQSSSEDAKELHDEESAEDKRDETTNVLESTVRACATSSKITCDLMADVKYDCQDMDCANIAVKLCNGSDCVTEELPTDGRLCT